MTDFEKLSDFDYDKLCHKDIETLNKLKKRLFGLGLIGKILVALLIAFLAVVCILCMIVFFAGAVVGWKGCWVYSVPMLAILSLPVICILIGLLYSNKARDKMRAFMRTEEASDYNFICELGKLDSYAKLYGDTLCLGMWELSKSNDKYYLSHNSLKIELTEEEHFNIQRQKADTLVVIRNIYSKVQKNGNTVSYIDLAKALTD